MFKKMMYKICFQFMPKKQDKFAEIENILKNMDNLLKKYEKLEKFHKKFKIDPKIELLYHLEENYLCDCDLCKN